MVTWSDIVKSVEGFFEWLQELGAGFTDSLGELGSWLFGGLQWLGDRFKEAWEYLADWLYNAIVWLANKLKEAYETLATWLAPAIQWIGSGLSWIGQNLYNFGQWLYNGVIWVANSVWELIISFVNWILEQLASAWNTIVSFANSFISGFNQSFNNWVKGLRAKFKQLMLVNMTIPTTMNAFEKLVEKPSLKGVLGIISAPFISAVAVELLDAIVPTPESETVLIFYPFELPMWEYARYSPTRPEYLTPPESVGTILPPAIGFRPLVELEASVGSVVEYELGFVVTREFESSVASQYEVVTGVTEEVELEAVAGVEAESMSSFGALIELEDYVSSEYEAFKPASAESVGEAVVGAVPEVTSAGAIVVESVDRNVAGTEYLTEIEYNYYTLTATVEGSPEPIQGAYVVAKWDNEAVGGYTDEYGKVTLHRIPFDKFVEITAGASGRSPSVVNLRVEKGVKDAYNLQLSLGVDTQLTVYVDGAVVFDGSVSAGEMIEISGVGFGKLVEVVAGVGYEWAFRVSKI